MSDHDRHAGTPPGEPDPIRRFLDTPAGWLFCVALAAAGLWLWVDHRAHILGALPYLLPLLACLGMHFFMHRGHGGHGGGGDADKR